MNRLKGYNFRETTKQIYIFINNISRICTLQNKATRDYLACKLAQFKWDCKKHNHEYLHRR